MPRTQLPGDQVTDGTITTADIADFTVRRADLHTTTPGEAVIAKAVAGAGIELTSTGADAGTGDVTIKADIDGRQRLGATLATKVPGLGAIYFTHDGQVAHSDVPIILQDDYELQQISISVNVADPTNTYVVRVYDISGTPTLIATLVTLTATNTEASATGLTISLPADSYGFTLERTVGSGVSAFDNVVLSFLIEKV